MTEPSPVATCGHVDYVWKAAACLGALGYSPHEVHCLVAAKLGVEPSRVAEVIRRGTTGSVPTAV